MIRQWKPARSPGLLCLAALLVANIAMAGGVAASTLVFEASFTVTLSGLGLIGTRPNAYDYDTQSYIPFNASDYTAAELGIAGVVGGREIGEQWQGTVSVYDVSGRNDYFSVRCTGALLSCTSDYAEFDPESLHLSSWAFSSPVRRLSLGPEGGHFHWENEGQYSGRIGSLRWDQYPGGGASYGLSLSDVRITGPAPVPLPVGGLLLGSALVLLAGRAGRRV